LCVTSRQLAGVLCVQASDTRCRYALLMSDEEAPAMRSMLGEAAEPHQVMTEIEDRQQVQEQLPAWVSVALPERVQALVRAFTPSDGKLPSATP
jgi:hypothetical protein